MEMNRSGQDTLRTQGTRHDASDALRAFRGHADGRFLRARETPLDFHSRLRGLLRPRLGLRFPPGRLALRLGRSGLVRDRCSPLVAGAALAACERRAALDVMGLRRPELQLRRETGQGTGALAPEAPSAARDAAERL